MNKRVKNLRRGGKEVRWWDIATWRQEGEEGWRRAQEREVMEGCAGETMGEMASKDGGKGEEWEGKRMGDMNGLGIENGLA